MPAYIVNETYENTGGVVFATSKREALKWGADQYADGEKELVEAVRRKDLDRYEATGVPSSILVEEGWWFECSGCGMLIQNDALEEAGLRASDVVGTEHGRTYCCHACRAQSLAREAAQKTFGEAFQDMLRDMVRKRFGDDVVFCERGRNHVYVPYSDPLVIQQASVAFEFPGQKIGPATLRYEHSGQWGARLMGPVKPHFECCFGDKEVFEAWAEHTRPLSKQSKSYKRARAKGK